MKMDSIEELCRTCLTKTQERHSLFEVFIGTASLDYIVTTITGIKIQKDDGLPSSICCKCKLRAENAYEFQKTSQEAQASLKGLLKTENLESKIENQKSMQLTYDISIKTENVTIPDHDEDIYSDVDFDMPPSNEMDDINKTPVDVVKNEDIQKSSFICKKEKKIQDKNYENKQKSCIKVECEDLNSTYCPLCGTSYNGTKSLTKHMWDFHSELMGPRKRGRPKKTISTSVLNKLTENGLLITTIPADKLECGMCDYLPKNKEDLALHLSKHDIKVYSCALCKKMYIEEKQFELHKCVENNCLNDDKNGETIVSQPNKSNFMTVMLLKDLFDTNWETARFPHICPRCSAVFLSKEELGFHHDEYHPDLSQKCNFCSKMFGTLQTAARHRALCKKLEKKYKCSTCGLMFPYEISLNKHILRYHEGQTVSVEFMETKSIEKKFQCDTCKRRFFRKELLIKHTRTHMPKKFECDICQKTFNRHDNLRLHKRIHDPNRQKPPSNCLCLYCGRGFTNSSNLIVHMRRHTGEKPYKCDFCDKGFPRSSDLQCHRRSHTGEKPCVCGVCGKAFSRSNKLTRHMRVHTGQRPYKCTYCEKAFSQSNDLTLHVRRHTGDRPYICEVCGDRFIQGTALQNHRRAQGHFAPQQAGPPSRPAITYILQNSATSTQTI